jgi:predicted outer membrane repeat protein
VSIRALLRLSISFTLALGALAAVLVGLAQPSAQAQPLAPATVRNYPGAAPCNTTLQACLSGSSTGDIVNVLAGTYITNQLLITHALVLQGAGPTSTILQPLGAQRVISVGANIAAGVTISNLRVFSGTTTGLGAGIFSGAGTPLTLQNMEVLSNTNNGNSGGGIFAAASLAMTNVNVIGNRDPGGAGGGLRATADVSILNGRFERNVSGNPGGAMRVDGPLSIRNTTVISNSIVNPTTSGGGIRADGGLQMRNVLIQNNSAPGRGGGIFANSADITIGTFNSNSAAEGGGLFVTGGVVLTDSWLQQNVASAGNGGALNAGSAQLRGVFIIDNHASADGGGAWVRADSSPAHVFGSLLASNTAGGLGGGVYVSGTLVLTAGTEFGNAAVAGGGGAYAQDATIVHGSFQLNVVSTTSGLGGGLLVRNALSLSDTQFLTNSAFAGGGAYISGTLVVTGGQFISNTAGDGLGFGGAGGGVYVVGAATLSGARFERNREVNFGTADGGGLFALRSLVLSGTQFISNTANGRGGGVNVLGIGTVTVIASEFTGNGALQCGGLASPILNVLDTQFVANTVTGGSGGGACAFTSASIRGGRFENNSAGAGGGLIALNGVLLITNTQFISNSATQVGGAVLELTNFAVNSRIVNSLFARNQASVGAALDLINQGGGSTAILHSTFVDRGLNPAQAIALGQGGFAITDTIVVSHAVAISQTTGSVREDYNMFFGNTADRLGTVSSGGHSFDGNPAFVNSADDNYHLSLGSAAIDAGINAGISFDFDGDPRLLGAGFDIGFDEFPVPVFHLFLPLVMR